MGASVTPATDEPTCSDLSFDMSNEDVFNYLSWSARNLPSARRSVFLERLIILTLMVPWSLWGIVRGVVPVAWMLQMAAAFLAAILVPEIRRRLTVRAEADRVCRSHRVVGRWEIACRQEGLNAHGPTGQEVYLWESMNRTERNGNAVYLFLTESNALVVPSSAFMTDVDATEFLTNAAARIAENRDIASVHTR